MSASAMLPPPRNPIVSLVIMRSSDVEVFALVGGRAAAGEAIERVALEDLVPDAAGQPLTVQLADHRRHHEAVADEAAREVEAVDAGRAAEDRVAIGRAVVGAGPLAEDLEI